MFFKGNTKACINLGKERGKTFSLICRLAASTRLLVFKGHLFALLILSPVA